MESNHQLPFKVGQQAEAKSLTVGFRSAWFRCKIKNISFRRGQLGYFMEFFDYPDEKDTWTKLYQKSKQQHIASHEGGNLELMVRPPFPPYYHESQLPDSYPASDVVVIVNDTWKVGDLVDWWSDCCYWSGRVIQLLGNDKVQIQLPDPPTGEGNSYPIFCKDLRPSLDWSQENGWTVPLSTGNGTCWHCARLIRPHSQDEETEDRYTWSESTTGRERNNTSMDIKSGSSAEEKSNGFFEVSDSHEVKEAPGPSIKDEYSSDNVEERQIQSYSVREIDDASMDIKSASSIDEKPNCFSEILNSRGVKDAPDVFRNITSRKDRFSLDSVEENQERRYPGTIESSVMKIEELANKIRWMKGVLQFGYQWSNAMKPSWRLLENCGNSSKM